MSLEYDELGRPFADVKPRPVYGSSGEVTPEPAVQQTIEPKPTHELDNSEVTRSGVRVNEYQAFVQKNHDYYVRYFQRRGGKLSWNWSAFLLGPLWLIYRKMFALAAFWSLMPLAIALLAGATGLFPLFVASPLVSAILLALVANRLYYLKATQYIAMQKISPLDVETQKIKIIRAGGTLFSR